MARWILTLLLTLQVALLSAFSEIHQIALHPLATEERIIWESEEVAPFDEIMLTWNGDRPQVGGFVISIAISSEGEWSPELPYMYWGAEGQRTLSTGQDSISRLGNRFRVVIQSEGGAALTSLRNLTACTSRLSDYRIELPSYGLEPAELEIKAGRSQMVLRHPRSRGLCSPVATSTAMNYLLGERRIDPLLFAEQVRDERIDIYGNWVLNVAQAAALLGPQWHCYVARLNRFEELHARLMRGLPVVVSIKGPIPGAALPYSEGHLLLIRGYEPVSQRLLVVDSAFPTDDEVFTSYLLDDFLAAWSLRKNVAYIFEPADI